MAQDVDLLNEKVDGWHKAAAEADSTVFFNFMHDEAIYIGTAPKERWTKSSFYEFAIPYFRRGKAWSFTPITRHWNFSKDGKTAWFDEVISTWMQDCQSTGVLIFENKKWKIIHYQLSVLIENEKIKQFINLRKSETEDE